MWCRYPSYPQHLDDMWQLEPGAPTEYLVANWTALSLVFQEASWPNKADCFFPLKIKIIRKKKTSLTHIWWHWLRCSGGGLCGPTLQLWGQGELRAGLSGCSIQGVFASVPGNQLLVQEPAEGCPLLQLPLWLLQEYQIIMWLAHAWVFLLVSPAEEELGAFP